MRQARPIAQLVLLALLTAACTQTKSSPQSPFGPGVEAAMTPDAKVRVGLSFLRTGNFQSAMNLLSEAAREAPDSAEPLLALGQAFMAMGDAETSVEYYRRAREMAPERVDSTRGLARAYVANRQPGEAVALLEAWRADKGEFNGPMYNVLGLSYDLLGAHKRAKSAYRSGLDLVPGDPALSNNLALSYAVEGRFSDAVGLLQDNLNNPLTQEEARENLALIYALSGQLEAAENVALTVLSPEAVRVNRGFYARLPGLSSKDRARAVFLGELPALAVDAASESDPAPPSEEERAADEQRERIQAQEAVALAQSVLLGGDALAENNAGQPAEDDRAEETAAASAMPASSEAMSDKRPAVEGQPTQEPDEEIVTQEAAAETLGNDGKEHGSAPPNDEASGQGIEAPAQGLAVTPDSDVPVYRIQLGSFRRADGTRRRWAEIIEEFPEFDDELTPMVQFMTLETGDVYHRLIVDEIAGFSQAKDVCDALSVRKFPCVVTQDDSEVVALEDLDAALSP